MALESIALIPSGYKATKVYSQLPVNGNGDFTFDRGTSADQTRVNKNGLIESVAVDVPRLDYLDGGCPSLLLEPASTNLVTYSEELDNAYYNKTNVVVTANNSLSPDGSVNAELLTESVMASSQSRIFKSGIVVSSGVSYTLSAFVKFTATSRQFYMGCSVGTGSTNAGRIYVNSDGGFSLDGNADGGKVEDYGNGWFRVQVNATSATTSATVFMGFAESNSETYTSDGSATMYVFGVQLEQQSYATSYMPTSGATATRDAEVASTSTIINEVQDLQGVMFIESRSIEDVGLFQEVSRLDVGGSVDNSIRFLYSPTSLLRAIYRVGAVSEFDVSIPFVDLENYTKVAIKWDNGDVKFYVNGLLTSSQSGVTMLSGIDTLVLNNRYRLKKLSVYDQALSTTELETLTGFTSFAEMATYLSYS